MITPAFGLTATERVLPKLALDFTTASLDSRVTFTRTTDATHPATYVNSSGLVTAATNNQPRFDYTPLIGGACKGLLLEEARTNINTNSVLANVSSGKPDTWAAWSGTQVVSSPASIFTNIGTAFQHDITGTERNFVQKTFAVNANTTYVFSFYIEYADSGIGKLATFASVPAGASATALPAFTTPGRYQMVVTVGATAGNAVLRIGIGVDFNITGPKKLIWSCPQLETGAFATSYIPTTTTAVTRNADVAMMTGTNFSDWFNASEGTFVLQNQYSDVPTGSGRAPIQLNSDASNFMQIYTRLGTINGALGQVAGVTQWVNAGSTASTSVFKTAFAYKANDIEMATNGTTIFTDTSASIPTVNQLIFPSGNCGYVAKLNYYPSRLTSAQIKAFSKQG